MPEKCFKLSTAAEATSLTGIWGSQLFLFHLKSRSATLGALKVGGGGGGWLHYTYE